MLTSSPGGQDTWPQGRGVPVVDPVTGSSVVVVFVKGVVELRGSSVVVRVTLTVVVVLDGTSVVVVPFVGPIVVFVDGVDVIGSSVVVIVVPLVGMVVWTVVSSSSLITGMVKVKRTDVTLSSQYRFAMRRISESSCSVTNSAHVADVRSSYAPSW